MRRPDAEDAAGRLACDIEGEEPPAELAAKREDEADGRIEMRA